MTRIGNGEATALTASVVPSSSIRSTASPASRSTSGRQADTALGVKSLATMRRSLV